MPFVALLMMVAMETPAMSVAGTNIESPANPTAEEYAAMELFELCDRYDAVSDRLAEEYIATRTGATEELTSGEQQTEAERQARRKAFYEQVQRQVRYNETRAELRLLVEALGARECPARSYEFDPLIDDA